MRSPKLAWERRLDPLGQRFLGLKNIGYAFVADINASRNAGIGQMTISHSRAASGKEAPCPIRSALYHPATPRDRSAGVAYSVPAW